jgi:hypothetical protein
MADTEIPAERQGLYYLGMVLMGAGFLLFISNFFFVASEMGSSDRGPSLPQNDVPMSDPDWWEKSQQKHNEFRARADARFEEHGRKGQYMMYRALGGMGLIALGSFLMRVGAAGLAGAGVVLNPQQARQDLKPWSKSQGGMIQDALEEVELVQRIEERLEAPPVKEVVKIRCRKCSGLNDETGRFCSHCGTAL